MIAFAHDNIIPMPQKSNEWYTPACYVEAAREVMGSIDLDPASCEIANRTVKAKRYYTERENGLTQPWYGNVWCNPPYGRIGGNHPTKSWQCLFVANFLQHRHTIDQCILLLLGNACFQKWFYPLWEFPICIHDGKIEFERESGLLDSFGFGTTFVYFGANEQRFINIFSEFGTVARRVSKPKERPVTLSLWGDA